MRNFFVTSSFVLLTLVIVVRSCPLHHLNEQPYDDTQNLATDEESIVTFQSLANKERRSVNMGGYFSLPERNVQPRFGETSNQEMEQEEFRRGTRSDAENPDQNERIEIDRRRRRWSESESSDEIVFSLVNDDDNDCSSPRCHGWVRKQILPMETHSSSFSAEIFDIIDEASFPPTPLEYIDAANAPVVYDVIEDSNPPIVMTDILAEPELMTEEGAIELFDSSPEIDTVLIASEDQPMSIEVVEDSMPLNIEKRELSNDRLENPEELRKEMVTVPLKSERRKRSTSTDSKPMDKSKSSKYRPNKRPHKKHKRSSPSKHF